MPGKIGVIGGSGVYNIEGVKLLNEHNVSTPFGEPSDVIFEAELSGAKFFFLPRHARGHKLLPSEVNYRANIFALKKLGVDTIISVSAVGSLTDDAPPRTMVLPDQFIDWTKGKRERTFFGNGVIGHVSTAYPIDQGLKARLAGSLEKLGIKHVQGGSYICIEGPQFSSRAESELYRQFGATVIGMTNVPESYLAKEAGMAYATVAMVTDFDCWKEEHCTVEEIMKVMADNNKAAHKLLGDIIPDLYNNEIEVKSENRVGILTPLDSLSGQQREIVDVLLQ